MMTDTTVKNITTVFPVDAEAIRSQPKLRRRCSVIREFSLNTSTHAIPRIARGESIPNRIFWTLSLLACTATMLFFIIISIKAYFNFPTQTSVSIIVNRSQPFPAVSICNISPLRFDAFIDAFINYTNSQNLTNLTDNSTITYQQAAYLPVFFQYLFNIDDIASLTAYFYHLNSMLLSCSYNGRYCNATNFIQFISASYGLCYTFNAKMKSDENSIRFISENGGTGLLRLQLYAHNQQYVPYITEGVTGGMVAMIHDNTELPLIELGGIQLAPGKRHRFNYKKQIHSSLSWPYSNCTTKIPVNMQALFNTYEGADYVYSQVLCNTLCVQTYVYHECSCINPYQWTARYIIPRGKNTITIAPLCNVTDTCYADAGGRIFHSDSLWNEFCSDCAEACTTVDFTVTPSSVSAPSSIYKNQYKTTVEKSGVALPKNWSATWETEFDMNYVAVDIVCETTRVQVFSDNAVINSVDLLSNVGGQTGLWIGISFLSIMELIEIFYRLIRYQYNIFRRRRASETNENF